MKKIKIFHCKKYNDLFTNKFGWHHKEQCFCNYSLYAEAEIGKFLEWGNGLYSSRAQHPVFGLIPIYHALGNIHTSYTKPYIGEGGYIFTEQHNDIKGCWEDIEPIALGLYNGIDTCIFEEGLIK